MIPEFSFFKPDITNYSLYYSTQTFSFSDIVNIIGIECLENNLTTLNFNCTGYQDGTYYFMIVAYNPYGNSSSNCLEIIISLLKVLPDNGDDDDDFDEGNGNYFVIVAGSIIAGVIGAATIGFILHKRKLNRLKNLDKIVKSIEKPKEDQRPQQQDDFDI